MSGEEIQCLLEHNCHGDNPTIWRHFIFLHLQIPVKTCGKVLLYPTASLIGQKQALPALYKLSADLSLADDSSVLQEATRESEFFHLLLRKPNIPNHIWKMLPKVQGHQLEKRTPLHLLLRTDRLSLWRKGCAMMTSRAAGELGISPRSTWKLNAALQTCNLLLSGSSMQPNLVCRQGGVG